MLEAGPIAVVEFTTSDKTTGLTDLAQERNIDVIPVPTPTGTRTPPKKPLDTDSLGKGRDKSEDRGFSM